MQDNLGLSIKKYEISGLDLSIMKENSFLNSKLKLN